jgi:hypothetical protein
MDRRGISNSHRCCKIVPDQLAVITSHELRTLEDNIPSEIAQLNYIKSQLATPHGIDMASFLRASKTTRRHYQHASQCLNTFIILSAIVILAVTSYFLKTYWHKMILCFFVRKQNPDQTTPQSNPVNDAPSTSYDPNWYNKPLTSATLVAVPPGGESAELDPNPNYYDPNTRNQDGPDRNVTFSVYGIQQDA